MFRASTWLPALYCCWCLVATLISGSHGQVQQHKATTTTSQGYLADHSQELRDEIAAIEIPPYEQPTTDRTFYAEEGDDLITSIIDAGRWPFCTWAFELATSKCNTGFIDRTARYNIFTNPPSGVEWARMFKNIEAIRITGKFPNVTFFSFVGYPILGFHDGQGLPDYKIIPKTGKNPFADPTCKPDEVGTYEVHVSFGKAHGFINEIVLPIRLNTSSITGLFPVVMRLYGVHDQNDQFGGPVPIIDVLYRKQWLTYKFCSQRAFDTSLSICRNISNAMGMVETPMLPGYLGDRLDCPLDRGHKFDQPYDHFSLYGSPADAKFIVSFTNPFSHYMYHCMSPKVVDVHCGIFARVRGRAFTTPDGLFNGIKVSEPDKYEVRYQSFTALDLNIPQRVFSTVDSQDMKDFYRPKHNGKWDGRYRLIFAMDESIPKACNMYDSDDEMFLSWITPEYENNFIPSIIAREILSTRMITGFHGKTMEDLHHATVSDEGLRNNSDYMYNFMGDHYPIIEVWRCNVTTGHATLLATKPPEGAEGWNL